jgi:nucleotide-binding universal stress UspA family protein
MKSAPASKKILVPCDGSKPSARALAKADELLTAASNGANKQIEFILLYVVPYIEAPLPLDESGTMVAESAQTREYIKRIYSYQRDRAFAMLQKLADKFINRDQFSVDTEVLFGSPAEKIIEFAHEKKVEVIVMGNIGLSGFSKLKALGSVSRSVSERAGVPVMIVPYSSK